jgi:glutathione S-transferase
MLSVSRAKAVTTSVVASTLRGWRGASASRVIEQPPQLPEIYDREGCAHCRFVREALTELNLDARIVPVPIGATRFINLLREQSGDDKVPFMVDPNSGVKLAGSDAIVEYLFSHYGNRAVPQQLKATKANVMKSRLATVVRGSLGLEARPAKHVDQDLTLYSFEASPYSRLVRERLCELELPYKLVNIGKQQLADVGPATFRLHWGEYKPLPNTKRSEFLAQHGNVQVPYLVDPNSGVDLFESDAILAYLNQQYKA